MADVRTDPPFPFEERTDWFVYDRYAGTLLRRDSGQLFAPHRGSNGYLRFKIEQRWMTVHRLVWFFEHGSLPLVGIDHVDTNKINNRIANLRLATDAQNNRNRSLSCRNTSGLKGITFNRSSQKWQAQIRYEGESFYIGVFDKATDAHAAYAEHCTRLHGEFARLA